MPRPTLKGLAKDLELSVTTVSRALAGYSDVSKITRERIIEAANAAGYVPNSAGKSLVTGKTGFIGLLMPLSDKPQIDPFFSEFLAGLGQGLQARQKELFLATVGPQQAEMDVLKRVVEGGRADGVVLTRILENDERVDYLSKRNFPFITHGRTLPRRSSPVLNDSLHWVDTDGETAFAEAFDMLYTQGHRKFGLISIDEPMSFRHYRERGLQNAIHASADEDVSLTRLSTQRFDEQARSNTARQILSSANRPTAIFALTDEIALSLIEQAALLNIDIPGELSVIGFDNLPASAWSKPALSTFDQDTRATAFTLATRLVDIVDDTVSGRQASEKTRKLMNAKFVSRESHGPCHNFYT